MRTPVLTPASTTSGSWPRYWRQASTILPVRGGTTEARQAPLRSSGLKPEWDSRPSNCRPNSSGMRSCSVANRQRGPRVSPWYTPRVMLVLPISMVINMRFSSVGYPISGRVRVSRRWRLQDHVINQPGFAHEGRHGEQCPLDPALQLLERIRVGAGDVLQPG